MKKKYLLYLLLVLIFLIPFSSCAQTLSNSSQWWSTSITPFANDESGYYVSFEVYLYFIDKESLEPIILCSRLDCLHTNESNPAYCDAYCEGSSIGFFQDHLYFVMSSFKNGVYSDAIFQAQKDGSQHQEFINLGDFSGSIFEEHGFINGYYLYILKNVVLPEDTPDTTTFEMTESLYMINLRKSADPPVLIETWNSTEKGIALVQVVDDALFYMTGSLEGEKTFWRYNLVSYEKQRIMDYTEVYNFSVLNDRLYLLSSNHGIEAYNAQSQSKETIFSFTNDDDRGFIKSDGQYFYVFQKSNRDGESSKEALVIDNSGNIVNRLRLPEPMLLAYVTKEYLFLRSADSYDFPKYAIRREDIPSPDVQLIPIKHP
jgi:hypothetical protein